MGGGWGQYGAEPVPEGCWGLRRWGQTALLSSLEQEEPGGQASRRHTQGVDRGLARLCLCPLDLGMREAPAWPGRDIRDKARLPRLPCPSALGFLGHRRHLAAWRLAELGGLQAGPAVWIAQAGGAVQAEQAVRARPSGGPPGVGWEEKGRVSLLLKEHLAPNQAAKSSRMGHLQGSSWQPGPWRKLLPDGPALRHSGLRPGKRSPVPYLVTPLGSRPPHHPLLLPL